MVRSTKRSSPDRNIEKETAKQRKTESGRTGSAAKHNNVFQELIANAGIQLDGEDGNIIEKDQVLFQSKFSVEFKKKPDGSKTLKEFIAGLCQHMENAQSFKMCLLPTSTSPSCTLSSRGAQQESLVRILLGVPLVQTEVGVCLLEKLAEVSMSEDKDFAVVFSGVDVPRLVVSQFRWLDKVSNSKVLTDKMFEIISVSESAVQQEIISCIPDLVEDARHKEVSLQLKAIMEQDLSLCCCTLEAISNLNLKGDALNALQSSVMKLLDSAKSADIPVIVKFILQSIAADDAFQVIAELREHLVIMDFTPMTHSTPAFPRQSSRDGRTSGDDDADLTFEVIKSALMFNPVVASGWLKVVDALKEKASLKVVDLFVLLSLYYKTQTSKQAISILRSKIKSHVCQAGLTSSAFQEKSQVFMDLAPTIISLADNLLRSPEPIMCNFGSMLYKTVFSSFDTFCQQEVVAALVTHVGSGIANETEAAFDVLHDLVRSYPEKMFSFLVFLKGILEYVDNLTIHQIRSLFSMLGFLGSTSSTDGNVSSVLDELLIFLRKQLSSSQTRYKRIGIIGTTIIVGSIADQRIQDGSNNDHEDVVNQTIKLLQMLQESTKRHPKSAALFYDELSDVIKKNTIHPKILEWIADSMMADFQEVFTIACDTIKTSAHSEVDLCFDLDGSSEEAIAVNIAPMLLAEMTANQAGSSSSRVAKQHKLVSLAPHFRVVQMCERSQNGNLDGIAALLGCPIALFSSTVTDTIHKADSSIKETVCLSLVYTINWLQEVVNAFVGSSNKDIQSKVLQRLLNIDQLSRQLGQLIAGCPLFSLPVMHFDCDGVIPVPPKPVAEKKRASKTNKKSKNASKTCDSTMDDPEHIDCEDGIEDEIDVAPPDKCLRCPISEFRRSFREMDMELFALLKYDTVSASLEQHTVFNKSDSKEHISARTLLYLLEDFSDKLTFKLPSSHLLRRSFFKTRPDKHVGFSRLAAMDVTSVVRTVVDLLPALLHLLQSTLTVLKEIIDKNDGIVDSVAMFEEHVQLVSRAHTLLVGVLHTLLSWNGFSNGRNEDILCCILTAIAKCNPSDEAECHHQPDLLARDAAIFLSTLKQTTPSSTAAKFLVKVLLLCRSTAGDKNDVDIHDVCQEFLRRDWLSLSGKKEKGSSYNATIGYWIQVYISSSPDAVGSIEAMLVGPVKSFLENGNPSEDDGAWNTLNKNTFSTFYKSTFEELVVWLRCSLTKPKSPSEQDPQGLLKQLNSAVKCFHMLINIVKVVDSKVILGYALKNGKVFLELFVKHGMPILDKQLRKNKESVSGLLKNLQQSTRSLNHFCCHLKTVRDSSLTSHVPAMKKLLEMFVFRVKTMLALNNCHDAFWLGNLKNRDLQGNEIQSQVPQEEADEHDSDEASEENNPPEVDGTEAAETIQAEADDGHEDDYADSYSTCY